jgi:pimeloyl-ACP methyl ester carboxylesterase
MVASVNESYEEELGKLRCPVTLVWGENDQAVPLALARRAQALMTGETRWRSVPDCAHFVPTTAPEALVDAVREMLA